MARFPFLTLALCAALSGAARVAAAAPAYYVSPGGSDANTGTSAQAPFLTLERARDSMRASPAVKTVYLLGGVFKRALPLTLEKADAGESWLGYPGQTAVLDGSGRADSAFRILGASVTVRWLTIRSFAKDGILARDSPGTWIDSDRVFDTLSTAWSQGAIHAAGTFTGGRITRNLVRGADYCGIIVDTSRTSDISGLVISGNAVYDTCRGVHDCGGIYADDRGHRSAGIVVSNNVVGASGTLARDSKGIYLDDELSNAAVFGNVVFGSWRWALQVHGGDHDVIRGNVFDISAAGALALYQDDSPGPNYGMAGNVFACNVVYSTAPPPATLWDFYRWKKIAKPVVRDNLYWDPRGALPAAGPVADASPLVADPGFQAGDPDGYRLKPGLLPAGCGVVGVFPQQAGPISTP